MGNYSMLDLFRQEVETQVTNLKQSLSILKRQPSLGSELETATRSHGAIAGSAQMVELEAAANLATEMKAGLIAVEEHSIDLTETQIDRLLHAGDLLVEMSHAGVEDLERWLAEHTEDLSSTQAAIALLASLRIDTPINSTDAASDGSDPAPVASPRTPPPLIIGDSSMMELFRLEVAPEMEAPVVQHEPAVLSDRAYLLADAAEEPTVTAAELYLERVEQLLHGVPENWNEAWVFSHK